MARVPPNEEVVCPFVYLNTAVNVKGFPSLTVPAIKAIIQEELKHPKALANGCWLVRPWGEFKDYQTLGELYHSGVVDGAIRVIPTPRSKHKKLPEVAVAVSNKRPRKAAEEEEVERTRTTESGESKTPSGTGVGECGWHKLTSHLVGSILSFLAIEVKVKYIQAGHRVEADWSESQYPAISKFVARLYESVHSKQRFMEIHMKVTSEVRYRGWTEDTLQRFLPKFKGLRTLEVTSPQDTWHGKKARVQLHGLLKCYRIKLLGSSSLLLNWGTEEEEEEAHPLPPHLLQLEVDQWSCLSLPRYKTVVKTFQVIAGFLHRNYLKLLELATTEDEKKVIPRPLLDGFEIGACKRCYGQAQWLPKCTVVGCYLNDLDYCYTCLEVSRYGYDTDSVGVSVPIVRHYLSGPRSLGFCSGQSYTKFVKEHNAKISCTGRFMECAECERLELVLTNQENKRDVPLLEFYACRQVEESTNRHCCGDFVCTSHRAWCSKCDHAVCRKCKPEEESLCKWCEDIMIPSYEPPC